MAADDRKQFPFRLFLCVAPAALVTTSVSATSSRPENPLRFFEGRTEMTSTVKLVTKRPYRSRTFGQGRIAPDGTLHLVQRVEDDGRRAYDRRWRIRQVGPGRFSGTMSEARGPVTAQEVGGRYRFRFRMKGSIAIEQWLTPVPGGQAARSTVTIRKLGMTVGHSEGVIRKL